MSLLTLSLDTALDGERQEILPGGESLSLSLLYSPFLSLPLQEHGPGPEGAVHPRRLSYYSGIPDHPPPDRELPSQQYRYQLVGPTDCREGVRTAWM